MANTPDSSLVYVAFSNAAKMIDTSTNAVATTIPAIGDFGT